MIGPFESLVLWPIRLQPRWEPHLVNICEESALNGYGNALSVAKSTARIEGTVAIVVVECRVILQDVPRAES